MRAYIEWVFKIYYDIYLARWAISRQVPRVGNRTMVTCFEDLVSADSNVVTETVRRALGFLVADAFDAEITILTTVYEGGHATSHDEQLRGRLKNVIDELDKEFFGGDIAWLNSSLPC